LLVNFVAESSANRGGAKEQNHPEFVEVRAIMPGGGSMRAKLFDDLNRGGSFAPT
jgi:hypothetical protein